MEDHASDNTDVPRTRTFYLQQTVYKVQDMDKMKEGISVYRTLLDSDFVQSNPELIPIVGQYVNDARVQGKFEVSPWHAAGANIKFANEKGAGEIDMTVEKFIEIAEKFNKEEDEQGKSKQKYLDNEKKYLGQFHPYKGHEASSSPHIGALQAATQIAPAEEPEVEAEFSAGKEQRKYTEEGLLLVPPEAMQRAAHLMMELSKQPLKLRLLKSLKLWQGLLLGKIHRGRPSSCPSEGQPASSSPHDGAAQASTQIAPAEEPEVVAGFSADKEQRKVHRGRHLLLLIPPVAMQGAARLMMELSKRPLKLCLLKSLKLMQSLLLGKSHEASSSPHIGALQAATQIAPAEEPEVVAGFSAGKEQRKYTEEGLLLVTPEAMQRAAHLMMELSKQPLKLRRLKSLKLWQGLLLGKSKKMTQRKASFWSLKRP
ncbi:Hypothetical predicted protein [Cloeon dipterum]|uniref:Uncharacterized protein n=1 Tax=Cloeon dipterum TaxID=197152 RepID=A0A8S1E1V8_9INSE|nr:Hypothetical predicted protein [Cloeon dipterum]